MWGRIDVGILRHPKMVECSKDAKLVYIASILYSIEHGTDGTLRRKTAALLLAEAAAGWDTIGELIAAQLWEQVGDEFKVHDFLEYQPSADEMHERQEHISAVRAAAGRRGAHARWNGKHGKRDSKSDGKEDESATGAMMAKMANAWHDTLPDQTVPDIDRNDTERTTPASQPDTRASTRDTEPKPGLAGLGLKPLDSNSTRGDETELQAMWRTVHAVTAILDDTAPSDEELGNYFVGVQENWYYNGTSRPADLLAVAREQRAGTRWPPASKSAQFRVYARNRTGRGDLNPRPKPKSSQNGHVPVPASNPAWNDRPADTWYDPEADRLHALTMARMGIDENGNEIPPVPDQKGPAA